jgi:Spy/CpxP family protein refolding chaperone
MKRKLMFAGVLIGTMLLALGTAAAAQGRGHRARHGKMGWAHGRTARMTEKLDLTAEQTGQMVQLRQQAVEKAKPIGAKLRDLTRQSRAAWTESQPDERKIVGLHREMRRLRGELEDLRISFRFDVWELLTPEQRAELRQRGEARPGRGFRGGRGRDRGDRTR